MKKKTKTKTKTKTKKKGLALTLDSKEGTNQVEDRKNREIRWEWIAS